MPNFIDAVGESVNRAACVVLGSFAANLEILQYVLEPFATAPNYNGAAATYAARCGLPLPPSYDQVPPFSGGQCPGVNYRVDASFDYNTNAIANPGGFTTLSGFAVVPGRVLGTRIESIPGRVRLFVRFDGGEALIGGVNGSTNPGELVAQNDRITSITRPDGQPDNCGNPPYTPPSYQPGSNVTNENVTYEDNSNNSVTIPVVIGFGYATVNVNGQIEIPVTLNFTGNATLNANGTLNFTTGDFNFNAGNPNAPRPSGCSDPNGYQPDPSVPTPPSEIPDEPASPPDPDDPPEPESVIKGCVVTVASLDDNETLLVQNENPDIYIPAVGYVQFKIRFGDSTAWTNDIPVKNKRCFIPCPWEGGAVDVKGTPRFGNQFVVTPIYGIRNGQQTFPE